VEAFDLDGQPFRVKVDDLPARVIQHETDHLDGILYPMRMRDLRLLGFTDVLFPDAEVIDE
jgi:peptide deformylase